jgi:phage-Barnase-EndoU-ColicinE5/D-RelE like nuclease3
MGSFVADAVAIAHRLLAVDLGAVSNADQIKAQASVDVTGYRRWIDNYGLRHALASHGNHVAEAKRGQVGITVEDLALANQVTTKPDSIADGGLTNAGRQTIVSQRVIGDHLYFVSEELRPKWKRLALLTMWKRRI